MLSGIIHFPIYILWLSMLQWQPKMAALQGKFWQMHDIIFENQNICAGHRFQDLPKKYEMDMFMFIDNREHQKLHGKVIADFESGVRSGVNATPTFFINGLRYKGMSDFDELYKACNYTLLLQEAELKQPEQNKVFSN
jgi:hypothetical protein